MKAPAFRPGERVADIGAGTGYFTFQVAGAVGPDGRVMALAPAGRVVIIDYRPKPMSERPRGPPPEQQCPKEQLDGEMAAAGFKVVKSFDFLPEQFFVIYVPK